MMSVTCICVFPFMSALITIAFIYPLFFVFHSRGTSVCKLLHERNVHIQVPITLKFMSIAMKVTLFFSGNSFTQDLKSIHSLAMVHHRYALHSHSGSTKIQKKTYS